MYPLVLREVHPDQYRRYMDFEAEATSVVHYAAHVMPGLLQTEAYARACLGCQAYLSADQVNERVTGTIGVKLYKGHARIVTRASPNAVYDASLASFSQSGGLFSQTASPGFIELWSLQSRMAWRLRND